MRLVHLPKLCLRSGICLKPNITELFARRRPILQPSRQIAHTTQLRQDDRPRQLRAQKAQVELRPEQAESIKPETYQESDKARPDDPPKTDGLLSEQTVSNKEQRKADWAIMKEMARYLWPKVWQHVSMDPGKSLIKYTGRHGGPVQSRDSSRTSCRLQGRFSGMGLHQL